MIQTSGRIKPELLHQFTSKVFVALGFTNTHAEIVADSLTSAELEGAGSHGISRLAIYAKCIREGRIKAKPDIQIEKKGALLMVNGDNGLGHVVANHALDEAIPLSKETGIVGVLVRNSNHFGTAAYFCQKACRENVALIATTNSPPAISPWGGKKPFFGTNPLAFGFPTKGIPPIIIDMSSSVASRGKIILASKIGEEIPLGWAMDINGNPTNNPLEAIEGSVLPLGGAKGYALAMGVEVLSAILTGAAYGPHVNNLYKEGDPPANIGHCFILLNLEKFLSLDDYFERIEQFIKEIKETPRIHEDKEVLYPGERRYRSYIKSRENGVLLSKEILEELEILGKEVGVEFPF